MNQLSRIQAAVAVKPPRGSSGRRRRYLTESEIEKLLATSLEGKSPVRNYCLLMLMYGHGLRLREALDLRMSQISLVDKQFHVLRLKGGVDVQRRLEAPEIKAIKDWFKERDKQVKTQNLDTDIVFLSNRGGAIGSSAFQEYIRNLGVQAKLPVPVHPHMLRHSCGYAMANQGMDTRALQDFLGHRCITQTVKYTASNSARFDGFSLAARLKIRP